MRTSTAIPALDLPKHFFTDMAFAAACLIALVPRAMASEALAKKHACAVCHLPDKKAVGPSWQDVATKYRGNVTPEQLAASIKKGGSGIWGPVPMPPQPQVPDADLSALAAWILQGGKP